MGWGAGTWSVPGPSPASGGLLVTLGLLESSDVLSPSWLSHGSVFKFPSFFGKNAIVLD